MTPDKLSNDQLIAIIDDMKTSAINYRERRHEEWRENYMLYRDKVITNRFTQRQSVNVPLMKGSVQTLLKDIDDPPMLYFKNLDNDDQKELFYNEYWNLMAKENKLDIKDLVDKKQVLLYGRSFKKLNIVDGQFYFEIIDPMDILVDRFVDPAKLDTARFIIHEHIYRPISVLESIAEYDQEEVNKLKIFAASQKGLLKINKNVESLMAKNQKLKDLGVTDADEPVLAEGYVELNHVSCAFEDDETGENEIWSLVIGDGNTVLLKEKQEKVLGATKDHYWKNHHCYNSWASDVERNDFWSDGVCDTIRTMNKVLNIWISQLIENRVLRNYGMNYYDASISVNGKQFSPITVTPEPGQWIPLPGKPGEVFQPVQVPDLSESLDEMNFVMDIVKQASAATTTNSGGVEKQNITLGEVQLALANAQERVRSLAILYMDSWLEFGVKYSKLVEASGNQLDDVEISKKGKYTNKMYTTVISGDDLHNKSGYYTEVKDLNASRRKDIESLQFLSAARNMMPNNMPLNKIVKRKALEMSNALNATEIKEVMDSEEQQVEDAQLINGMENGMQGNQPMLNGAPRPQAALPASI